MIGTVGQLTITGRIEGRNQVAGSVRRRADELAPLEEALVLQIEEILGSYPDTENTVVKFALATSHMRDEAMEDLYNSKIREVTLFPGLDGFARSLAFELEFRCAFDPKSLARVPGFRKPPGGWPEDK